MTSSFLILTLLLLGAGVSLILARFRPRYANGVALAAAGLALLPWLLGWAQLPMEMHVSDWLGDDLTAPLSWTIDGAVWHMSLILLVLLISALLVSAGEPVPSSAAAKIAPGLSLLLLSVGLVGIWVDALVLLLPAWALIGLLWTIALTTMVTTTGNGALRKTFLALASTWAPLLFIGLGAANLPALACGQAGSCAYAPSVGWSSTALFWLSMAALWQLWVAPFAALRLSGNSGSPGLRMLLYAVPATSGAILLYRLLAAGEAAPGLQMLFALLGLLALLWAINRAWGRMASSVALSESLWFALAGLVLLAAVSGNSAALSGQLRVLLLAGGILLLLPAVQEQGAAVNRTFDRIGLLTGPIIAVAAMAAFPLTAGFAAYSAELAGWLAGGYWLLLLLMPLLLMLLIAAGLSLLQPVAAGQGPMRDVVNGVWRIVPGRVGLIIPALLLLSATGLLAASLWSWLLILLTATGSLLLFLFLPRVRTVYAKIAARLAERDMPRFPAGALQRAYSQSVLMLQQAATMLEGEWGLLLLLLLFALLLWLR